MDRFDHSDEAPYIVVYGSEYDEWDEEDVLVEPTETDLMDIENNFDKWMDKDVFLTFKK